MTRSLTVTFALFLAWPAAWGQEQKEDDPQLAIETLRAQMREPVLALGALDQSDRDIVASTQNETTELVNLKRREIKVNSVDKPAVADRRMTWQRKLDRHHASGCPTHEGWTGPPELVERCNPVVKDLNAEFAEILKEELRIANELAAIVTRRAESSITTQNNFLKQKANNAARDEQKALQIEQERRLRSLYRNRILSAVNKGTQAEAIGAMSRACSTIADEEKQVCCHRVVTDGVDPARCDVKLIYERFERGGVFPNSGR